jgi:chromosome segregation ATPase
LGELSENKIKAFDKNNQLLEQIKEKFPLAAVQNQIFTLQNLEKTKIRPLDTHILETLFDDPKKAVDTYFKDFLPAVQTYSEEMTKLFQMIQAQVDVESAQLLETNLNAIRNIFVTLLAGLLLGGGATLWVIHKTNVRLKKNLSDISTDLASLVRNGSDLTQESSKLSSSIGQSTTSLVTSLSTLKDSKERLNTSVGQLAQSSEKVKQISESESTIKDRLAEMEKGIQKASQASSKIENAAQLIESLAFQTNLLALNAAVEAARAGDSGRGFSVVADSVRDLSQKSNGAAQAIRKLLEETQNSNKEVTLLSEKVHASMLELESKTNLVASEIDHVTRQIKEDSVRIDHVATELVAATDEVKSLDSVSDFVLESSESISTKVNKTEELLGDIAARMFGKFVA